MDLSSKNDSDTDYGYKMKFRASSRMANHGSASYQKSGNSDLSYDPVFDRQLKNFGEEMMT